MPIIDGELEVGIDWDRVQGVSKKDTRLYSNSKHDVVLCLSCAVERRNNGAQIEMKSDKVLDKPCADCEEKQGRLL